MTTVTDPDPKGMPTLVPLEANPEVLSALLKRLGLSDALALHDVFSLSEPSLLAMVPRPAHALLLVFPISAAYESHRLAEDALQADYQGRGPDEPVVWFRQTVGNMCGLVALLHASFNGPARSHIGKMKNINPLFFWVLLMPGDISIFFREWFNPGQVAPGRSPAGSH